MLIAQLSDCHISTPEEEFSKLYCPADRLRAAIRHVNGSLNRPDLVFLTGDLINSARREEYDILRDLLPLFDMPVYLLPGNHDDCALLREAFPDHDYLPESGDLNYVVDGWPLKIICLDTNLHGKAEGVLGEAQLDWLDRELGRETARRVLIFMHHPPFLTGLAHMDGMSLLDRDAFTKVIARHDTVERVMCGHVHRSIQTLAGGTLVQTCPSTSHQILLHLGQEGQLGTVFEPPEYLLHYWTEDGGLVTHNEYVTDYDIAWTLQDGVK